jgi:hypothetical protein
MRIARLVQIGAGFAAAAIIAVIATAPLGSRAADHLDAPNLAAREDADINDVYAFPAGTPGRTAIAVTTSPAAGVIGPIDYATNVRYKISIDRNGDAVEDLAYVVDFSAASGGSQAYTVTRYAGANARTLDHGLNLGGGQRGTATALKGDGIVFAGLRADPFFFDLAAFKHVVLGAANGRTGFCDQPGGTGIDFFASFNTNAIVLELPNETLSDTSGAIGVWATTLDRTTGSMIDQMGRPAINTVFNHTVADKQAFNVTPPAQQPTTGNFRSNVITTLESLGGYGLTAAGGIADFLLPDVLTYTVGTTAAGPLNGRAPADDVIDVELGLVTQGAITTDCVGPHTYLSSFPYLNVPH